MIQLKVYLSSIKSFYIGLGFISCCSPDFKYYFFSNIKFSIFQYLNVLMFIKKICTISIFFFDHFSFIYDPCVSDILIIYMCIISDNSGSTRYMLVRLAPVLCTMSHCTDVCNCVWINEAYSNLYLFLHNFILFLNEQ